MTAIAIPRRNSHSLLFVVALVGLAIPLVMTTAHAGNHEEAGMIRECAKNPANLLQIWINKSGERLNCLVQLPDGRVGDHVIQGCRRGWLEVTNYIIAGGSLEEAIAILTAKACVKVYP